MVYSGTSSLHHAVSPDIEVTSESAIPPPLSVASHPGWRLCLPQAVKYTVWSSLYTQYIAIATRVAPNYVIARPRPHSDFAVLTACSSETTVF